MKYNSVTLLLGYSKVFFQPKVLDFLPFSFSHILSISGKPHLLSWERLDRYILRTEKQDRGKLMFMPFEMVSICVWLWYFFHKRVVLQLIHIDIKSTY